MYPLNVTLVGFADSVSLFDLRRELQEASAAIEAEYPDVSETLTGLPLLPSGKRLLILYLKSEDGLKQLEHLNETYPGQPILVVLEAGNEPVMVFKTMRAGAAQVVMLPLISEDFQSALHRLALQFGQVQSESTVIAVSGVSEGCGATTIAINLAREIAQVHQKPCILVELAFQMGRLACYLNLEPRFTTGDLLYDVDRMDLEAVRRSLTEVSKNLSMLAGPYQGIVPVKVSSPVVVRLLNHLRQLGRVVVVDMPYRFDAVYFDAMALANRAVLVAEQKVPSLHALRLVMDALAKHEIAATKHVVINRYDPHSKAFSIKRMAELLKTQRLLTIANDYPNLATAANDGRPLRDSAPHCQALADFDHMAAVLLGVEQSEAHKESFLSRLIDSFRTGE